MCMGFGENFRVVLLNVISDAGENPALLLLNVVNVSYLGLTKTYARKNTKYVLMNVSIYENYGYIGNDFLHSKMYCVHLLLLMKGWYNLHFFKRVG